jgi:3-deoxy-manno-octulosonate cytidylyltransferase (CMP-KDO synthetase)
VRRPPRVVAIIPARYDSSRFPGKALADLCGTPMIAHVVARVRRTPHVDHVLVATDDDRIAAVVRAHGGEARLTSGTHRTGTDRVAEAARALECDIVVNVQGDEPLIEPAMIAEVIQPLLEDPQLPMATLRRAITDPADYQSPHVVKVTTTLAGDALYFSRAPIPGTQRPDGLPPCDAHVGLYAYQRQFLLQFAAWPQTPLEQLESLEQLRALEHGARIRAVPTCFVSVGVDTPDDLERAREHLLLASHT